MKNKDIKNKLRVLADKQEIKNYSNEIISKVDTSNVYLNEPLKSRKRYYKFALSGTLACACAALLVALGINLGLKNQGGQDSSEPKDDDIINYVKGDDVITYLDDINSQEYYNIVNVANNLDDFIKYDKLEKTTSKELTKSEEEAIVSNISAYVYNMEDMFGLAGSKSNAFYKNNSNDEYDYEYDLEIKSQYYNYHVYYDEVVVKQTELNGEIIKLNSNTFGEIVLSDVVYYFTGNKIIKNNKVTFTTKIFMDDTNSLEISETFGEKENEYIYSFVKNSSTVKKIEVVEKKDDTLATTKIKTNYIWINGEVDSKVNGESDDYKMEIDFTKGTTSYIDGSFKSKNKNHVYINKEGNSFTYTFKNSQNKY